MTARTPRATGAASSAAEPATIGFTRSAVTFVAIGASNNLVQYGLFALFTTALSIRPTVALTITYVLGMVVSFFGNRSLTFRHSGDALPTVLKFLAANAVGYAVNFAIIHVFVDRLHYPALVVQLFAIAVVATITFFSMRLWVFRSVDKGTTAPDPALTPSAERV